MILHLFLSDFSRYTPSFEKMYYSKLINIMILKTLSYIFNYLCCECDLSDFDVCIRTSSAIKEFGASGDLKKDDDLGRSNQHQVSKSRRRHNLSQSGSPILKQFSFEGISGSIFFGKIYYLIWRKFIANICCENILFDLKKIYCQIYFEKIKLFDLKKIYFPIYFKKIYYLIRRKFIDEYILRKYIYTFRFEENKFIVVYILRRYFVDLRKIKNDNR